MNAFAALAGAISMAGGLGQSGAPSDVPTNHWAYPAVDNLYKAGILKGYPDGMFRGNRPASRYELASILFGLNQGQTVSTQKLQQQLDALKAQLASKGNESTVSDAQMKELREQILALRAQVDAVKAQRAEVAPLTDKFQSLHDQLAKIRENLDSAKKDLEKAKSSVGS